MHLAQVLWLEFRTSKNYLADGVYNEMLETYKTGMPAFLQVFQVSCHCHFQPFPANTVTLLQHFSQHCDNVVITFFPQRCHVFLSG